MKIFMKYCIYCIRLVDTFEETTSTKVSEVGIKDIPEKEAVGTNESDVVDTVKETKSTIASDVCIKDMPEKEVVGAKESDVVNSAEETTSTESSEVGSLNSKVGVESLNNSDMDTLVLIVHTNTSKFYNVSLPGEVPGTAIPTPAWIFGVCSWHSLLFL